NEAIAVFEKAGSVTINLAIAASNRGDVIARHDCEAAIRDFTRAIELLDKLNVTNYVRIYPLSGKGACLVRTARPAEAIPLLEQALRIKASGSDLAELARVKLYLGRALVETHRDVAGGLAMARAARPAMVGPDNLDELPAIDRWLAAHAP